MQVCIGRAGTRGRTVALLIGCGLWLAACGLPTWLQGDRTETVLTETTKLVAVYAQPRVGGGISAEEARRKADNALVAPEAASTVRAERLNLTLRSEQGEIQFQPREVWLVTYEGRAYKASPSCTCYVETRPNTTVVVDAATATVVASLGTGATD